MYNWQGRHVTHFMQSRLGRPYSRQLLFLPDCKYGSKLTSYVLFRWHHIQNGENIRHEKAYLLHCSVPRSTRTRHGIRDINFAHGSWHNYMSTPIGQFSVNPFWKAIRPSILNAIPKIPLATWANTPQNCDPSLLTFQPYTINRFRACKKGTNVLGR